MKLINKLDLSNTSEIFILQKNTFVPHCLNSYIKLHKNNITVLSDLTGQNEISIFIFGQAIIIANSLEKLVNFIHNKTKKNLTLSTDSVSHLLHDAAIPSPYTIYNEIYSLGIGHSLSIDIKTGEHQINDDFPYFLSLSRQDSINSNDTLLDKIANSLEQGIKNSEPVLMLSSGKDSISLAIACAEIGIKCKTVTFKADEIDNESEVAKYIATKFGLEHEVITLDNANLKSQEELVIQFFQESVHPCVDFSQLGYVKLLAQLGIKGNTIIDGSGNDIYFAGGPSKIDKIKYRLTIGNLSVSDSIKGLFRHSKKASYLLRNDAEISFSTRTFRYADSKKWFKDSFNTSKYWRERCSSLDISDYMDLDTYFKGRDYDRSCSSLKGRVATSFSGNKIFYPYCESELIDYCFNLPEKYRFDRKNNINKVIIRNLLNEKIQYDALVKGKHGFNFDGRKFIENHETFVKHEILSCDLWERDKMNLFLDHSLKLLKTNFYESHGIINLFLLSGWLNHNQYLNNSNS